MVGTQTSHRSAQTARPFTQTAPLLPRGFREGKVIVVCPLLSLVVVCPQFVLGQFRSGCFMRSRQRRRYLAPHIHAGLQPRRHGILHLSYRLDRRIARCAAPWQIRCRAEPSLVVLAPECLNQIRLHISLPLPAIALPGTARRTRHDSGSSTAGAHPIGHRSDANPYLREVRILIARQSCMHLRIVLPVDCYEGTLAASPVW